MKKSTPSYLALPGLLVLAKAPQDFSAVQVVPQRAGQPVIAFADSVNLHLNGLDMHLASARTEASTTLRSISAHNIAFLPVQSVPNERAEVWA